MSDVLLRLGFEDVDEAVDGVEALTEYRKGRYELVVTDLSMPRMGGIDLLRAIRVMPGRETAAVLIASGHFTERNLREAREAGVDGLLPKPFIEGPLTEQVCRLRERVRRERSWRTDLARPAGTQGLSHLASESMAGLGGQ